MYFVESWKVLYSLWDFLWYKLVKTAGFSSLLHIFYRQSVFS